MLSFGRHAKHILGEFVVVPVPDGLDPVKVTFARMAAVSMAASRASDAELGDFVAVIGLGLVGNLSAQLFGLAGCEVIGIDPSARRREQALACGVPHVIAPGPEMKAQVAAITEGRMCAAVIEATGLSSVAIESAPQLAARFGEIVLLGSPRAPHVADVTPFLSGLHLCNAETTVKGALEWRYPLLADPSGFCKHSIENNVRQLLRMMSHGKLNTAPLLTHLVSPADCHSFTRASQPEGPLYRRRLRLVQSLIFLTSFVSPYQIFRTMSISVPSRFLRKILPLPPCCRWLAWLTVGPRPQTARRFHRVGAVRLGRGGFFYCAAYHPPRMAPSSWAAMSAALTRPMTTGCTGK